MPMDLLRWAASGELSYLNMAEVARPVREAAGESVLPENIVRPLGKHLALLLCALQLALKVHSACKGLPAAGVPGLHGLMADAARLAKALKLTLPGANAVALLRRFIMELGMPQVLCGRCSLASPQQSQVQH